MHEQPQGRAPTRSGIYDDDFVTAADRLAALVREFAFAYDRNVCDLSPADVYNRLPAIWIDYEATPTDSTIRSADQFFVEEIMPRLKRAADGKQVRKQDERRAFFRLLFHAGRFAQYRRGCVPWSFNRNCPNWSLLREQVVEAARDADFFHLVKSPPGSPKISRLLPMHAIAEKFPPDPRDFDPDVQPGSAAASFVILRSSIDQTDLPFDPNHPVAADVQRRLERINAVNARAAITVGRRDYWEDGIYGDWPLLPNLCAIFHDSPDFDRHGRIYSTGRYGHQSLGQAERRTIEFVGEPSVELDYGGLHLRLLYHQARIDYAGDPYALWGDATTKPMRLLAKKVVNAAINAASREAAVSACNNAMRRSTDGKPKADNAKPGTPKSRKPKTGKAAADADRLRCAIRATGMSFDDIYDLAKRFHAPIAHRFGSGAGIELMGIDGAIALDVCDHFARLGVPCLPVHDSFVVPRSMDLELRYVMQEFYEARVGFLPVVKSNREST